MSVREGLYGLPEPALPPKPPSRWRWAYRIFFGLVIVWGLTITVLMMLGGTGDSMKSSIEKFIGDSTGLKARIETLNAATLFPVIGMDLGNLTLHDSTGSPVASFEHFNFSTGFWAAMIGKSSLRSVAIKNGRFTAGVLMPGTVEIDRLGIDIQDKTSPNLVLQGRYDSKPVDVAVGLVRKINIFGASSFDLREGSDFIFNAGPIVLNGVVGSGRSGQRVIEIKSLSTGRKDQALSGQLEFFRGIGGFDVGGFMVQGDSRLDYRIGRTGHDGVYSISGIIKSEKLNLRDVLPRKDRGSFVSHYRAARAFYEAGQAASRAREPFDFTGINAKIQVKIDALYNGDLLWGPVSAPLSVADGIMKFEPLSGSILGGALTGDIMLDATKAPATLAMTLDIQKLDYATLTPVTKQGSKDQGRADMKVKLTSTGNNTSELIDGLDGAIAIVAGEGELSNSLISLWGGGLANAMLPTLDNGESLRLHCGIGNFKVKDGVARSSVVFLDTSDVTVVGDGTINLSNMRIDMKLEPKSKGTALISAATAVNITGPLERPTIRPDAFSLGKKLGGLLLGTINPALLVINLTDFGGAEQHPCKAYIK